MIPYTLVPYAGALPITFDMSSSEVERIIGPPISVGENGLGEREEEHGPLIIRYSTDDAKVVEITFTRTGRLYYQGVDLLRNADPIGLLSRYDPPLISVGFVVFLGLGIMITGFHDDDDSQKAVTVFRKGRLDAFRNDLTPL